MPIDWVEIMKYPFISYTYTGEVLLAFRAQYLEIEKELSRKKKELIDIKQELLKIEKKNNERDGNFVKIIDSMKKTNNEYNKAKKTLLEVRQTLDDNMEKVKILEEQIERKEKKIVHLNSRLSKPLSNKDI